MKLKLRAALTVVLLCAAVWSERVPDITNYQGRLTDAGGLPVNGTFDMIFRIFDDSTGGILVYEISKAAVPVNEGEFSIEMVALTLSDGIATGGINFVDNFSLYLEIEVEGEIIAPRQHLASSPFSVAAHSLSGDIYTSPGRLYMVPNGPPVSDCTYVPLEMAVDADITRFRMRPYDWAIDCTYVPLEMTVDVNASNIQLQSPDPNVIGSSGTQGPAVSMNVSPADAVLWVMGVEPQPFKADGDYASFRVASNDSATSMFLRHSYADPDVQPSINMDVNPAQSIFWVMGVEPVPFTPDPSVASFSVEANSSSTQMFVRHPISDPNEEPAIAMDVSGTSALFEVWGIDPTPFRNNHSDASFRVLADADQASMSVRHAFADPDIAPEVAAKVDPGQSIFWVMGVEPQPFITGSMAPSFAVKSNDTETSMLIHHQSVDGLGDADAPFMTMSSAPATGASLLMFNPQPEPPANPSLLMSINGGPTTGASMLMFNPQPEPPGGPDDHTLSINGGLGDTGPGIFMFNPQPEPPGTPPYLFGVQTTSSGAKMDFLSEPAFSKSALGPFNKAHMSSDTSGALLNLLGGQNAAGGADTGLVKIKAAHAATEFLMSTKTVAGVSRQIIMQTDNIGARVGVNTTTPSQALHVVGNICATGTIGACSDERYKKDINTIEDALGLLEQLRGVNFNWRTEEFPDNNFSEREQVGFIAQEIEKVLPEVVSKGDDGFYSVDYAKLTPVLVEAVKAQQKTIDEVKAQNLELADELQQLKELVMQLAETNRAVLTGKLASADASK